MPATALIDYGCHSFTFRLASYLQRQGFAMTYVANGSLESPNLKSLPDWRVQCPDLIRIVRSKKPYGKMSLRNRLSGEIDWASRCIEMLEAEPPAAIVASCLPITVVAKVQSWARRRHIPFVYWLQDLQGIAIAELLGSRLGHAGQVLGWMAKHLELAFLRGSDHVITIAHAHEEFLPLQVRDAGRFTTLENWANIEDIPLLPTQNDWSVRHRLDRSVNILYSGTLGFKHDLKVFPALASAFRDRPDVRIVVVSSGAAADFLSVEASRSNLKNLIVLPFQPYEELPAVLASAAVLIAPLDPSAGSFCVPSKVLSYLCAGRPCVLAIDGANPAAQMIESADGGVTVRPGDAEGFVKAVWDLIEDPLARHRMGRAARAYAEAAFNVENVSKRFLRILETAGIRMEIVAHPYAPLARAR
ncbi:MAG TPA: glycosyltransferase family 4 protein [Bryobacteraceae bacterium]